MPSRPPSTRDELGSAPRENCCAALEGLPVGHRPAGSRAARNHILAFLACLALGFVFTLPGSLSLRSGLLGYPGDNFQHAWFLWHFAHALLHGRNPFYTRLLFYPTRVNLTWTTTDPLAGIMAFPFSIFAGPVLAYNCSLILQLALAAFCARLLCLRIAQNQFAALIGGVIFGFSPYLMAHALEHLSLVTAFPIPLFALALDRIFSRRSPSWRMGIPLGLALLLAALAHYDYAAMCIVFAAFLFGIEAWSSLRTGLVRLFSRVSKPIAAGAATFLVGFAPVLWMMLSTRSEVPGPRLPGHIEKFSAGVFGFLVPSWNHMFLGKFARNMNPAIFAAGIEGTVYIGPVVLALAAIGFWAGRKSSSRWTIRAAILGACFWLLSLGPRIHLLGHELRIPGPAALFFDLPFSKFVSAPARFGVIVALCLAILGSLGTKHLLESQKKGIRSYWILPLVAVLLLADYLTVPFPRASTTNPGMGYDPGPRDTEAIGCALPKELQHGTILTFPLIKAPFCLKSMWMQVSGGGSFAIVDGYLSYTPPDVWKPFWNMRILRSLMTLQGTYHAPVDVAADAASAQNAIRELNLTAVVVFDSPQSAAGAAYLERVFGARPEREGSCTIFRTRASTLAPREGAERQQPAKAAVAAEKGR